MQRNYESMVIINPKMGDESTVKKENEKILTIIKENNGKIVRTDEWGKRDLAYEINKLKEGYYFINYFEADAQAIRKLENLYRINENFIRYNIIALD